MTDANAILLYVAFPDNGAAEAMATQLLSERLIACANIFPPHQSHYRWQGKIEKTNEVAAIFKTQAVLSEKLMARVKALHPYETPCILALPVLAGDSNFLAWIAAETTA